MARTKTITIDNETFVVAALNIDQVEDYIGQETPPDADIKYWRDRMLSIIAISLNNASSLKNGDAHTAASLRKTLDIVSLPLLHSAVLEISGLRVVAPTENSPGESQAVPNQ